MSTQLLPKTHALTRKSRLRSELRPFSAWLADKQYHPEVLHRHVLRLHQILSPVASADETRTYGAPELERLFDAGSGPPTRIKEYRGIRRVYAQFLKERDRLLEPLPSEDPLDALQREYDEYLHEVRGVSVSTRVHHLGTVADFLTRKMSCPALSSLTQRHIQKYVNLRARALSRHSVQHVVAHLRAFFRYCFERGYLTCRLDTQIDTPRIYRDELPPRALPWPTVEKLLGSIQRPGKMGWRDHCLLHLIAHYGLRPSEVVTLRLDSIDWTNAVLRVKQHKNGAELLLPLAPPTVEILRDYLTHDRNQHGTAHPELFLRAKAPRGPLMRTAATDIFDKRMREAKLDRRNYSVYSLRHAFAMRLLTHGVGIKLIGDLPRPSIHRHNS